MVVTAAHGPQERRVMAAMRRLTSPQPGHNPRLLPPTQHPGPVQQAKRLQVLLLHQTREGLPSDTHGTLGHSKNGDYNPFWPVLVPFMPFGLRNASQTFQRFMDRLLKHLPFVFTYLNDYIIASRTLEEHYEHLRQFFTILQENGLQINPAKCVFAASAVEFLGHRVDQHCVRPLQRHINRRLQHPCGRRLAAASRGELATTGFLLKETVGGRHSLLHLRHGAAGRFQRGPTLSVPAGGVTFLPSHRPQATGHHPCSALCPPDRPANSDSCLSSQKLLLTSDTSQARRMWLRTP